jgi:hypothetical protein
VGILETPELAAPALRRHAPPELVIGVDPAAGANFTKAVDDGYWWRLLTVSVRLNTSATVANRTLRIEYRGPDAIPWAVNGNPVTYPASTVNEDYFFDVFQPQGAWEVSTSNLAHLSPLLLQPGHDFRIAVTNIQAGDTLTRVRYTVERFVPPSSDDYPYA